MSLTLRERTDHAGAFARRLLFSWRYWTVVGSAAVLFSFTGPFGTFERAGFPGRLLYWATTMAATSALAILVVAAASALAPRRLAFSFPVLVGGSIASCLPNTFVVAALISPLLGVPAPPLASLVLHVIPIGIAVGVVTWLAFERPDEPEEASATPNPLVERLPVEKRGPVVRMAMQDHYVEVVTTRGRELVLMRMGDAAAAMGEAGLRVHRSHWIGRDHVTATRREGAGAMVTTADGAEVPVSRSYVPALREAGLLPR